MKYNIKQGSEEINSTGGISIVGKIWGKMKIFKTINHLIMEKTKTGTIPHGDILKSMTSLFCEGRTDYADIELHKNDIVFKESLNLKSIPSEETLRQRIDDAAKTIENEILDDNIKLLKQVKDSGEERTIHGSYTPIALDVTPLDNSRSNKEEVGRTYKGHDGFAPMMAYIGTQGYLLNCELRPGTQHSQKGMNKFLPQTISMVQALGVKNALYVLDSAHDASENIDLFQGLNCSFLIKRNLRNEMPEQWLAMARRVGECQTPRQGKKIFTGITSHRTPANSKSDKPLFITFEVIERTIDAKGQILLIPDLQVNTWWHNIPDNAKTVIQFYHNHGTSEQFHSEFKTDMGIERLASGKFKTNALLMQLAMIAFNTLRIIGQAALSFAKDIPIKIDVQRRRLRSVIQDLIYIACKRVSHSNSLFLKFGRNCPWFRVFQKLYLTFC